MSRFPRHKRSLSKYLEPNHVPVGIDVVPIYNPLFYKHLNIKYLKELYLCLVNTSPLNIQCPCLFSRIWYRLSRGCSYSADFIIFQVNSFFSLFAIEFRNCISRFFLLILYNMLLNKNRNLWIMLVFCVGDWN